MQEQLLQERCIVVDENDCQVRAETKLVCHQMVNINAGLLHRAFSLFVFSKGRLLLQQRALAKVTFPAYLTNSCCSHPLYCDQERNETRHIGIKTAVLRKLTHELGIATGLVHADQLQFLTRIHYKAAYDAVWGEHEIDYIFILNTTHDLHTLPNANEVKSCFYVTINELKDMMADPQHLFTPWFLLIAKTFLFDWWGSLDNLAEMQDDLIHRL